MIIANLNKVSNRFLYLKLIKREIKDTIDTYKHLLKNIFSRYNEDLINEAIESIILVGTCIYCPTTGTKGQILRALEYGTNDTKSYHLITYSTKKILKEVDGYEFVI